MYVKCVPNLMRIETRDYKFHTKIFNGESTFATVELGEIRIEVPIEKKVTETEELKTYNLRNEQVGVRERDHSVYEFKEPVTLWIISNNKGIAKAIICYGDTVKY